MMVQEVLRLGHIDALDRELIIGAVLKRDRAFLLAHPEVTISKQRLEKIKQYIKEREAHKPLAYILREKEFFNLSFFVNRFTLIPRPETELLVEEALKILSRRKKISEKRKIAVIDVGTGSGCIIISVAKNFLTSKKKSSSISFFGVDTSLRALQIAQKNALRHEVTSSISFLQSDLLKKLVKKISDYDEIVILANLPYLSETIYQKSDPTVREYEPKTALVSGKEGLDHYRELLAELKAIAPTKKVNFLLEISPEQAKLIPFLSSQFQIKNFHLLPDLTGRARLVSGSF